MGTRLSGRVAKGAWVTAGLLLADAAALGGAVAAMMAMTGGSMRDACFAVAAGAGWGGLTFASGWWISARKRERVGAEVGAVLAPVLRELKHLRGAIAQRGNVDEQAETSVHPRRVAPASDDAQTVLVSYDRLREAVR